MRLQQSHECSLIFSNALAMLGKDQAPIELTKGLERHLELSLQRGYAISDRQISETYADEFVARINEDRNLMKTMMSDCIRFNESFAHDNVGT